MANIDFCLETVHPCLESLSPDQIQEIADLMESGEAREEIVRAYQLEVIPELLDLAMPDVFSDQICPYCSVRMVYEFHIGPEQLFCSKCGHHNGSEKCECAGCLSKKPPLTTDEILVKALDISQVEPRRLGELSPETRLYLAAVLQVGAKGDPLYIERWENIAPLLVESPAWNNEIRKHLQKERTIVIHPGTPKDCFTDVTPEGEYRYFHQKVFWYLNVTLEGSQRKAAHALLVPQRDTDSREYIDWLVDTWRKIAAQDCIEFFEYSMNNIDVDAERQDLEWLQFLPILETHSTSQIYSFIWSATNYVARMLQEGRMRRNAAWKAGLTAVKRHWDSAREKSWDVSFYDRRTECPQGALGEIFYANFLRLGEQGFRRVPRVSSLTDRIDA